MDPHAREAAAAQAAMADFYRTVWKPKPGEPVRCELAFGGGHQDGRVAVVEAGGTVLVDTPEGRLRYAVEDLERIK